MMVRNGFVSNSSSSSFIAVAIEGDISKELKEQLYEDNMFSSLSDFMEDKDGIVGYSQTWDDSECPQITLTKEKINEIEKKVK